MQLLLTCATPFESLPLRQHYGIPLMPDGQVYEHRTAFGSIVLLHAGFGMVNTAWHLGRYFQNNVPEMALQFGIAGAFEGGPQILDIVEVMAESYGDLGAASPDGFLDLEKMGFKHFETPQKAYYNTMAQTRPASGLFPTCRGITLNRVSGTIESIEEMQQNWDAEVESMEGAAFFQACLLTNTPFRELRVISNLIEPRNRANWKIKEAIEVLNEALIAVIDDPQKFNSL